MFCPAVMYQRLRSPLMVIGVIGLCAPALWAQQTDSALVPLAYVRTLTIAPPKVALPARPPDPAPPSIKAGKAFARWVAARNERERTRSLLNTCAMAVGDAVTKRLQTLSGLTVVEPSSGSMLPQVWLAGLAPDTTALADLASAQRTDAALAIRVDDAGFSGGTERALWVHAIAYLKRDDSDRLLGPYNVFGRASTLRKWIGKGYGKTDADLVAEATAGAARQLIHALTTGEPSIFASRIRVAIVPALLPPRTNKQTEGAPAEPVLLPSVVRQADVLLQPDLGPIAKRLDPDDVATALRKTRMKPSDVWMGDGGVDVARVMTLASYLGADYVMVSRVPAIDLSEETVLLANTSPPREGPRKQADAEAEAYLIRGSDGAVIWHDRVTGSTTAKVEYIRNQPRVRTDEQCVADAVRSAYARLRFSLNDYKRRFER